MLRFPYHILIVIRRISDGSGYIICYQVYIEISISQMILSDVIHILQFCTKHWFRLNSVIKFKRVCNAVLCLFLCRFIVAAFVKFLCWPWTPWMLFNDKIFNLIMATFLCQRLTCKLTCHETIVLVEKTPTQL